MPLWQPLFSTPQRLLPLMIYMRLQPPIQSWVLPTPSNFASQSNNHPPPSCDCHWYPSDPRPAQYHPTLSSSCSLMVECRMGHRWSRSGQFPHRCCDAVSTAAPHRLPTHRKSIPLDPSPPSRFTHSGTSPCGGVEAPLQPDHSSYGGVAADYQYEGVDSLF